ncbi:ACP phosphodiesterase [Marinilabiliaceae bacterium ANBcel2]|nr:ACP phosphodiesterase [Marinilabiliaceae bacterium ANBcel2]
MNYLAHLYLSGDIPGVLLGNFIGDYVKGSRYNRYEHDIKTGILLHRKIDSFTDSHPLTKKSSLIFREYYRKYAGIVVDIVYDHFLAANWDKYKKESLNSFVSSSHKLLINNYFLLPGTVKKFLPFLIKSRRMENYKYPESIQQTLKIMSRHSSMPNFSDEAYRLTMGNYELLREDFFTFFNEMEKECQQFLTMIYQDHRQAI